MKKAQKLLVNVLLKRGAGQLEEWIGKSVRHGLTTSGGALVGQGLITGSELDTLAGAGAILAGLLLSLARIYVQKHLL